MKKLSILCSIFVLVAAVGCGKKEDPRERPNFVDTSDPSKVMQTMNTPKAKNSTALGGKGHTGPGGPGGTGPGK